MRPSTSTVALGLSLSLAGPGSVASAAEPQIQSMAQFAAVSADSDDLIVSTPPRRAQAPQPAQIVSLPPVTVSDTTANVPAVAPMIVHKAGSSDLGITAKSVQLSQLELQPPPPIGGYQRPAATITYSPSDTLEMDIDRNLAQLQQESNPRLTAGLGFRWHDGESGLNQLTEFGVPIEGSFSPWYTGTARFAVLPVALDAGSLATSNLNLFGANPILLANNLPGISPRSQSAAGVGLLGGYSYGDFSGQIGTTPLGFPVTNLVGMAAYSPKFLGNDLTIRFEVLRQPVTDSILSYAGTKASLGVPNAITGGAFGTNATWGGVVKNGATVSAFYDDQMYGAYASAGLASLTGTNVPTNSEVNGLLGAYFRPYKSDSDQLRVGISAYYAGFNKNLSGFTFGQGGYFSPHNFEAVTFPIEWTGYHAPWSYLASVAVGAQHFNNDSSRVFPYNAFAQSALATTPGAVAIIPGSTSTGPAINVKTQIEYALDNSAALGLAISFDNGNNYNEIITKLYLRKTFDWFTPVASSDPIAIAKRDQPQNRL
jgi:cellulose synthase operon protein C